MAASRYDGKGNEMRSYACGGWFDENSFSKFIIDRKRMRSYRSSG
jgi:hypothetical protein